MSASGPGAVTVRQRVDADLPGLVDVLAQQQPGSGYPMRWPLPFPPEQFISRSSDETAFVAELDGQVVGHVAVTSLSGALDPHVDGIDPELTTRWSDATGRPVDELAGVSTLFAAPSVAGRGVGRALLDAAEGHIIASGRVPVLDVLGHASKRAQQIYAVRGWRVVGSHRPDWLPADRPSVILMVLDGH